MQTIGRSKRPDRTQAEQSGSSRQQLRRYALNMDDESGGLSKSGWGKFAREFIPQTHRHLPMLRLYLPFRDHRAGRRSVVRWSRYVDVEEQPASVDWFEATARTADEEPAVRKLTSCMGALDASTAAALRDATGDIAMRCLRWMGYGETPHNAPAIRVFDEDYFEADLEPDDVRPDRRVPEFAWDSAGRLAWGSRLYPDSLIVAAELPIFRQLSNDPRIDTATVRLERDVLPRSAGD